MIDWIETEIKTAVLTYPRFVCAITELADDDGSPKELGLGDNPTDGG